jgi:methylmalonyl-CoA/ethylmalonyl-CoA epimerase
VNILKVDHIGIAVKNLAESAKLYELLGIKSTGVEEVAEQKVKVSFFPVGDSEIELLESTSPDGPIARYIEKNGEGLQHLALRVDNLEAALAELKAKGVRLINEQPKTASDGKRYAFIHPESSSGVLVELYQL